MVYIQMTTQELAYEVISRLKKEYPDADCTLDYDDAWKLLVSVRLAAQCTDARVNVVVQDLYANTRMWQPWQPRNRKISKQSYVPVALEKAKPGTSAPACVSSTNSITTKFQKTLTHF